jgi:hypothetical protein
MPPALVPYHSFPPAASRCASCGHDSDSWNEKIGTNRSQADSSRLVGKAGKWYRVYGLEETQCNQEGVDFTYARKR